MYGQPPPGYGQPPPPNYGHGQPNQVIIVQEQNEPTIQNITRMGDISKCEMCQKDTENVMRTKVGGVAIAWCCCLLVTTGVCFWVPCVIDSCKDTECVCQGCGLIKTTIPASCC